MDNNSVIALFFILILILLITTNYNLIFNNIESFENNFTNSQCCCDENSINKLVRSKINNISINNYSDPITIPGGFLIIKVNDIKELKKEINVENELKNLVINLTNQQLDQYSNLYFNKIKKNVIINEL